MLPALPAGVTESDAWMLLQLLLKASLILVLAAAAARPLRRAAARHLVWSMALGALLLLPPLALLLPVWHLPWLRLITAARPSGLASIVAVNAPLAGGISTGAVLAAVWAMGAGAVLGRMFLGLRGVRGLATSAAAVTDPWRVAELECLRAAAGVRRPVRLLRGGSVAMPATWGVIRPTILLPEEADDWSAERRRVVLLHELAHVARRDWATQTLATLCCAAYWFHPGAWWAARQMRIEREEACDDRVVAAGARPAEYAGHLLEVARAFRSASRLSSSALALARPSRLESRVRAVLDGRRDRRGVAYRAGLALGGLVGLALLPLAVATPSEQLLDPPSLPVRLALPAANRQIATAERTSAPAVAVRAVAQVPRRDPVMTPVAVPSEPVAIAPGYEAPDAMALDPAVLRSRSLAELIRATASPQAVVRRDAVRALAQFRDEAVVSPLARSLRDADPGVRSMAARALGEMAVVRPRVLPSQGPPQRAPQAEPPAEAAAYALANRAAEALRVSLADENPDVRDTALKTLEEMGEALESAGGGAPATSMQTGISTIVGPNQ